MTIKARILTRTVIVLSVVSLLNDVSSEMLYPVMPLYLKDIGFTVLMIGILEGIAEAVAGLSKGYFGKLSDIKGTRLPFVQFGYFLSSAGKSLVGAIQKPAAVLVFRSLDKVGKGVRTGARDAMLSDETTPATKGQVFGFHRGMDTLGAVLGPAIALGYLYFKPGSYRPLFLIAFFPSIAGVALLWLVKQKPLEPVKNAKPYSFLAFIHYLKESSPDYRKLFAGLVAFALFNSSDMFILLMAKARGFNNTEILSIYIFYNLVYAMFSYPMGIIADKIGLKRIFLLGLAFFAIVYAGLAINTNLYVYFVLIFLYGLYAAATDGISKAWITNVCHKRDTATAIGTYSAFSSIAAMVASAAAGLIWYKVSPQAMFLTSAGGVALVVVYFLLWKEDEGWKMEG